MVQTRKKAQTKKENSPKVKVKKKQFLGYTYSPEEKTIQSRHHEIPLQILLIPGAFLLISVILLASGFSDWAFLFMGIAIVIAMLMHG